MAYARLRPYEPKRGFLMRTYTAPWGSRFTAGQWCEVDSAEALEYLKQLHERPGDTRTPKAFDVCRTLEEAQEVIRQDKLAGLEQTRQFLNPPTRKAPTNVEVRPANELNMPPIPTHAIELTPPPAAPELPAVEVEDIGDPVGSPPPPRKRGSGSRPKRRG